MNFIPIALRTPITNAFISNPYAPTRKVPDSFPVLPSHLRSYRAFTAETVFTVNSNRGRHQGRANIAHNMIHTCVASDAIINANWSIGTWFSLKFKEPWGTRKNEANVVLDPTQSVL